jgi:hypothetical protein
MRGRGAILAAALALSVVAPSWGAQTAETDVHAMFDQAERYEGPLGPPDGAGWQPYRPRGIEMAYFVVRTADGTFTFKAPWGEPMVARPGDAIVRDPRDPADTYRIAAAAFACTYEILRHAP